MAATLFARELSLSFGATQVLASVSVSLAPGHRVGIVGPNGVGKSSLLRVLSGMVAPDSGSIVVAPPTGTIGYLPQEPDRRSGETVLDYLRRRTGVAEASDQLEAAAAALAEGAAAADDVYAQALERWLGLGGADIEARAAQLLEELGIGASIAGHAVAELSGGQAARVSLAAVVLSRFDVLLLDEPTNDLDFDGLDRLESFVLRSDGAVAVVSHDRAFLEGVISDVLELDEHSRSARYFAGGWSAYREAKRVAQHHAHEDYDKYASKREGLEARAQRQRLWSIVGVAKAKRDSSEKDKNVKAFRKATSEKVAAKARATERAMERLAVVEKPWQSWDLRLEIAEAGRSGDVVARLSSAVVRRGGFRLGPLDLVVRWADRIAIVGANGAGKSTLLDLLLGRLAPAEGDSSLGPAVVVGELEQRRSRFVGAETLVERFVAETGLRPVDARTLLAKFGLKAAHVARAAGALSPGERTRASLALFQARGVNCLVLDEPTNHLDLPAIEQLETAIEAFTGTVLLVSHDRALLERFAPTRSWLLERGTVVER